MIRRLYATAADLAEYLGQPEPTGEPSPDTVRLLHRASEHLDPYLSLCRYRTDPAGYPLDPWIRDALRDATCAQVEQWNEVGESEAIAGYSSDTAISYGRVSTSRRPSRVAPRAVAALTSAGIRPVVR